MSLPPIKSNSQRIRLLSIQKVTKQQRIDVAEPKLQLVWLFKNSNQLKDFNKFAKTEIRDKVNLIKCQKIESLSILHPNLEDNPCLVILQQSYQPIILDYFKSDKVRFVVYSSELEDRCKDFKKNNVYFMTQNQEMLISYVRKFVSKVNNVRQLQNISAILTEVKPSGRYKLRKVPKEQLTNPLFLNSNAKVPGPGAYKV